MRAKQIIYTWDYHHGQATRVITGGLPPLAGRTMQEKQTSFIQLCDHIRKSLMQEPRGHKNMLGAVLTEPVTPDGFIGMLFLSPQGFFEMCGDSLFSATAALIDSGILPYDHPDQEMTVNVDTVAGRVEVHIRLQDGEPVAITFNNVPSYAFGEQSIHVSGMGALNASLGYGGLTYAFFEAQAVGIASLKNVPHEKLLEIGSQLWQEARQKIQLPSYVGINQMGELRPVDLITIWEPLQDVSGARVANFYAPGTCGRTPSGTGLSARTAIEVAAGRLRKGETFVHESLLGLRFAAKPLIMDLKRPDGGPAGCVPAITARSFLMGTSQWVLHPEDPFPHGFTF